MSALDWNDPIARVPRHGEDVLLLYEADGQRYLRVARCDGARWAHPGTSAAFKASPIMWASIPLPGESVDHRPVPLVSRVGSFLNRFRHWFALLALMGSAWFAADGVSVSWGNPFPMFSGVYISPNNMAVAAGLLGLAFYLYFDRSGKTP